MSRKTWAWLYVLSCIVGIIFHTAHYLVKTESASDIMFAGIYTVSLIIAIRRLLKK